MFPLTFCLTDNLQRASRGTYTPTRAIVSGTKHTQLFASSALGVKVPQDQLLQYVFSPLDVVTCYLTGASSQARVRASGPDPGSLSLPADDGRHILFERGDALLQAL